MYFQVAHPHTSMSRCIISIIVCLFLGGKLASTAQDGYCFRFRVPIGQQGRCFSNVQAAAVASAMDCCLLGGTGWAERPTGKRCRDACKGMNAYQGLEAFDLREGAIPDAAIEEVVANAIVQGEWGRWIDSQPCSVTCGVGFSERRRDCNPPSGQPDVNFKCAGDVVQRVDCKTKIGCPVDGGWKEWSTWSPCSHTCGRKGQMKRFRTCTNPRPRSGGADCPGNSIDTRHCKPTSNYCPVDGGWSGWGLWTCEQSCANGGEGTAVRFRQCSNPRPKLGGRTCSGSLAETRPCSETECPVDGAWGSWTSWSAECSATCGDASFRSRNRRCNNPAPLSGGLICIGENIETKSCNLDPCPVDYSDILSSVESVPLVLCDDEDYSASQSDGGSGCQVGSGQDSEPDFDSSSLKSGSPIYY